MDNIFVLKDKIWWLKITDSKQLLKYYEHTASKWEDAVDGDRSALAFAIRLHAEANNESLMESAIAIREAAMKSQLDDLHRNGVIYLNRKGGFCENIVGYTQWVSRKNMIFPDYTFEDIRVKQFKGGTHWYAYIGDMQVRNGKEIKWDNYDDAYNTALLLVDR